MKRLVAVLLLLTCQSCFTIELWRERSAFVHDDSSPHGRIEHKRLERRGDVATALVVEVPDALRAHFAEQLGDASHARLTPSEHAATFALAANLDPPLAGSLRILLDDVERPALQLELVLGYHHPGHKRLRLRPGWRSLHSAFAIYDSIDIPLAVSPCERSDRTEPHFGDLGVLAGRVVTTQEDPLVNALWTPLTLLADAVCLPFELLTIESWW